MYGVGFEIEPIGLVADSERKHLLSLSTYFSKPNSFISRPVVLSDILLGLTTIL